MKDQVLSMCEEKARRACMQSGCITKQLAGKGAFEGIEDIHRVAEIAEKTTHHTTLLHDDTSVCILSGSSGLPILLHLHHASSDYDQPPLPGRRRMLTYLCTLCRAPEPQHLLLVAVPAVKPLDNN